MKDFPVLSPVAKAFWDAFAPMKPGRWIHVEDVKAPDGWLAITELEYVGVLIVRTEGCEQWVRRAPGVPCSQVSCDGWEGGLCNCLDDHPTPGGHHDV